MVNANMIPDSKKIDVKKVQGYADILREEIRNNMDIKIPDIPMINDPSIDVIFLERFMHVNGNGLLEKQIWEKYKDTLYIK